MEKLQKRIDEEIRKLNDRIELFETYIQENHLQEDFERFRREQHKKPEKHPLKDQIPRR